MLFFLFSLEKFLDTTNASQHIGSFVRQEHCLVLVSMCQFLHHLNIFLCKKIVSRVRTLTNGFSNLAYSDCLGFCFAYACSRLTLCIEDRLLLGSLSFIDNGSLVTLTL